MKRFAAVALREVAERRFVLVAAAAAAVLPFLVPFLPGVPQDQEQMARSITALILSCAFGLGGSLLVGASVVGRELAERRLSFHFARPVSAPVVWGGKLLGGLALVLLAELLVLLPTSISNGRFPGLPGINVDTPVLWAILALAVPFFLLAWVGSVALRSRSPWLVVDLVLLVAVPALLFVILRRLGRFGYGPAWRETLVAVGVLLVALLAATLAQVVAGRTDPRRGHGAQSLTLWAILLLGTAGCAVWAERLVDPGIESLRRVWAEPASPDGNWAVIAGSAREHGGGQTTYLVNFATGRKVLLPYSLGGVVSADGSRAARVSWSTVQGSFRVSIETLDLARGGSATIELGTWVEGLALSADGRRLAWVSEGTCGVVELPSLRSLASVRIPAGRWAYAPLFDSADKVRLHPRRSWRTKLGRPEGAPEPLGDPVAFELDVPRRALVPLATYPVASIPRSRPLQGERDAEPLLFLVPSFDRSRVLAVGYGPSRGVRLLDALTGAALASFDGAEGGGRPIAALLADGGAVVFDPAPEGGRLIVLDRHGTQRSDITLPAGTRHVRFAAEIQKGGIAVGLGTDTTTEKRTWYLADLGDGRLKPLPVEPLDRGVWDEMQLVPAPGSPATRLAWEKGTGRLVLFDPATGETKPLTRGKAGGK